MTGARLACQNHLQVSWPPRLLGKLGTVADCDEFLDCIDDMRRIDASSSFPAPARIDNLEISLQRERAMYAEHGEQEILACRAGGCSPPADAHTERREREARWRDELPGELLRSESHGDALGPLKRQGSSSSSAPSLTGTNVQPDFDVEWQHLDSPRVIWFDAEAVAAAADSLTGSRSGVVLAMQNSMRSNKRLGKSV
jgi:hypothetical protein